MVLAILIAGILPVGLCYLIRKFRITNTLTESTRGVEELPLLTNSRLRMNYDFSLHIGDKCDLIQLN